MIANYWPIRNRLYIKRISMGMGFVLSGMLCFFIAHLADKYSKKMVANITIFGGIFMIALSALF